MTPEAIVFMLITITLLWGGLIYFALRLRRVIREREGTDAAGTDSDGPASGS